MGAITIGAEAIDRDLRTSVGHTSFNKGYPATVAGVITSAETFSHVSATNFRVGIFRLVEGSNYTCVASTANLGAVISGSKQTLTGFSLPVAVGDMIGSYTTDGRVDVASSGGLGQYGWLSEKIDIGDGGNVEFTNDGNAMSLKGLGATVAKTGLIPQLIAMGQL